MVNHMKTTVEISDPLFAEIRRVAAREGVTVRSLIEAGLRHEVKERKQRHEFRLRRAAFRGKGLRKELANASWDEIRDLAYETPRR